MLVELQIENFALIDSVQLEFREGLNVLTGETGAGKSIVLDALGFLLGDPARVKDILCSSATDLGRERYFQGHGLVDVLRALQAV